MTLLFPPLSPRAVRLSLGVLLGLLVAGGVRVLRARGPVVPERVGDPVEYWRRGGFVEMVGPVRPPTSEDGSVRIVVMLRLPNGGEIATVDGPDGQPTLRFPAGTRADRIEYAGDGPLDAPPGPAWRALDVRSTTLDDHGGSLRVLRPAGTAPDAPLVGVRWPGGDAQGQKAATSALGALVESGAVLGPASTAERRRAAAGLKAINDCASCHMPLRAPGGAGSLVGRGTDASGFYQPATVLRDRAPLETYRPRDANRGDRFVRFVCGPSARPARLEPEPRCDGGERVDGILDVRTALASADAHATRLCASRRHLFAHLDARGRGLYAEAMSECEGGPAR